MRTVKQRAATKPTNTAKANHRSPKVSPVPPARSADDQRWDELLANTTSEQIARLKQECLEDEDAGPLDFGRQVNARTEFKVLEMLPAAEVQAALREVKRLEENGRLSPFFASHGGSSFEVASCRSAFM